VRTSIERKIFALEQRKGAAGRQNHFVSATDDADRDQQLAELRGLGISFKSQTKEK
jgi:hypothetical protein